MVTLLWCQNNVATSFWRHDYVIFALCVRWVVFLRCVSSATTKNLGLWPRFLSTESLGPCFSHGMRDHDQVLQHSDLKLRHIVCLECISCHYQDFMSECDPRSFRDQRKYIIMIRMICISNNSPVDGSVVINFRKVDIQIPHQITMFSLLLDNINYINNADTENINRRIKHAIYHSNVNVWIFIEDTFINFNKNNLQFTVNIVKVISK